MLPVIPQSVNRLIQDNKGQLSTYPFPDNVAGHPAMTPELRKTIYRYMLQNYIWPQIMDRKQFEVQWDKLLEMSRATWKLRSSELDERTRLTRKRQKKILDTPLERGVDADLSMKLEVSDTVIFDAIDRLTNLTHFISYKESLPVQYNIPDDVIYPYDTPEYSPASSLVKAANSWLKFNSQTQRIYAKDLQRVRHHFTYGVSFVCSEFIQKVESVPRRQPNGEFQEMLELTDIGITFQPISIRKLWLDWKLPVYDMDYQGCPFFFEQMPRFAIIANDYHPQANPFGFANQQSIPKGEYLLGTAELEAAQSAFAKANNNVTPTSLLGPEFSIELLWTFYPVLPLQYDEATQAFIFDEDGSQGIPSSRYIVQTFGNNLCNGNQEIIRLQRNFYPKDSLPIYGSNHMPSLDDGVYGQAIGSVLEGHYIALCKTLMQFIENKDWANNPPSTVIAGSPAMTKDLNEKGAKIPVNSQTDIQRREPFDLTQTTPAVMSLIRDQAQTSSKSVDSVLGKAMGSRTTASEATNTFQTAMAGITTDINIQSFDIHGGYATRVWDYTGRWVDPDVLAAITGSYGFKITSEHLSIRLGLKWDCGSTFVESITRQSNLRYILESSVGDPSINRAALWQELLTLWKFRDVRNIVNDGGRTQQIQFSTEQAIQTYLGMPIIIDPDQDHVIAINVKKAFLKDHRSVWNTTPEYVINGPKLVQQISMHQLYQQLLMQQQQLAALQQAGLGATAGINPAVLQSLQSGGGGNGAGNGTRSSAPPLNTGGQLASSMGGRL